MSRPLIVANWKMHKTVKETLAFYTKLARTPLNNDVEVVICPPYTAIYSLSVAMADDGFITLGAQNCHDAESGAYTGEISVDFLQELGCRYCLVGHSERRQLFNESPSFLAQKMETLLVRQLTPIYCIGEHLTDREIGQTFEVLHDQLASTLRKLDKADLQGLVIAYEPVWAIGTGHNASPDQAEEVHAWIKEWLRKEFHEGIASQVRVIYGGSVTPKNISSLLNKPHVNGALVGSASLEVDSFVEIVNYPDRS